MTVPPREPVPVITDHAVLRYAERVLGIPVRKAVEERVFSDPRRLAVVKRMQRGRMRLGESDVHLVVEDGLVVTVVVKPHRKAIPGAPLKLEHP